jgi:hypothetical protein
MDKIKFQIIRLGVAGPAKIVYGDHFKVLCTASIESGDYYFPVPSAPTFSLISGLAYIDDVFPLILSILSDLPDGDGVGAERTIHYTVDGSEPTEASTLYDEVHVDVTGFDPGDVPGTVWTLKAVIYHHVLGTVATFTVVKMGDFLYDVREYWTYDRVVLGGEIDSGRYWPTIEAPEDVSTPNLKFSGGEISSGTYTEIVMASAETLVEPNIALTGGIISQGNWWDPIVEPEPPWD